MNLTKKTGTMRPATIRFRTTRDPYYQKPIPTAASIHAVRQAARGILVRLRALRPVLGRRSFPELRRSLGDLIDITAESRDAEVQRRLICRMRAKTLTQRAGLYRQVLMKLRRRQHEATRKLARYLHSKVGCEHLRQLGEDLSALQVTELSVNLPRLAARRYRRVLQDVEKQLVDKITASHRAHRLRIRIRRARSLASMFDAAPGVAANRLDRKLNKMQEALGDLRDSMLLARWLKHRGIELAPQVRVALTGRIRHCLKRCKGRREPLRQTIRGYLRKTRS